MNSSVELESIAFFRCFFRGSDSLCMALGYPGGERGIGTYMEHIRIVTFHSGTGALSLV